MDFTLARYGAGFLAGLLTTLSPCVLPLLPVLIGSALAAHRRAPLALALGLALSYVMVGTLLAQAGSSLPLDSAATRQLAAGLLGVFGLILLSAGLARRVASATTGLADFGHRLLDRWRLDGLRGQFVVGLLLGMVWSPCVGPTLGAAIVLAGQGRQLPQVALLMGLFSLGATLPILLLALLSGKWMRQRRDTLLRIGRVGRIFLGVILIAVSLSILSGADRQVEGWLLERTPAWLILLTTRF
ncbi:cytochrome c biogenesis CcdA family protein [Paludibacterium purpuratum]|uniref:Cytochrome c biogenesis protein CcdA n=1 Tax=Paludibacterium purpuratum TaxID=1144873 RepID=A0A4R7B639_9NEIS|nr:cytochrome c biogenesis CcdA family protein [Paludibacterium purpuratum]TDR80088.1 cytochrome c biogenesis protein CcdA [Paludibacterium purpuratum]